MESLRCWGRQAYPLAIFVHTAPGLHKYIINGVKRILHQHRNKRPSAPDDVEIDDQPSMFVCPEEGCNCTFDSFSALEFHTDVGIHDTRKSGSLYDKVRKNWAEKFSSVENQKLTSNESSTGLTVNRTNSRLSIGWALNTRHTNFEKLG